MPPPLSLGTPPGYLARLRRVDAWWQPPLYGTNGPLAHARPPTVALDPASVGAPPATAAVADVVGRPRAAALRADAWAQLADSWPAPAGADPAALWQARAQEWAVRDSPPETQPLSVRLAAWGAARVLGQQALAQAREEPLRTASPPAAAAPGPSTDVWGFPLRTEAQQAQDEHGSSAGGASTPDSDAEMDALRASLLPPPRFGDQQAELIEQALRSPGPGDPGDAVRRAVFYGFLANHREQEAREAPAHQARELEDAARHAWWNSTRAEHQALIEFGEAGPVEWSEPSDSDAEGDRMVMEIRRRLREDDNNDQQMELLEQAMRVELMDQRHLDTEAERGEFRRRLVAHMQDRGDALRSPSPSERSA